MMQHSFLVRDGKPDLAYRKCEGSLPTVVFLGGFRSDMQGTKAQHFEAACRARGQAYIRFDYFGHGLSGGAFVDGTLGGWLGDVLDILDALTEGPIVLVGSSMGGWLGLLAALRRPERVIAFVGLAAAPDFSEEVYRENREACERQFAERGWFALPNDYSDEPYMITQRLMEEARNHLLLDNPFHLGAKVRLVQGMADADVAWDTVLRIRRTLLDEDVEVYLLRDADHRLSGEAELALIDGIIAEASGLGDAPGASRNLVTCRIGA